MAEIQVIEVELKVRIPCHVLGDSIDFPMWVYHAQLQTKAAYAALKILKQQIEEDEKCKK
jgi:hypothetical protein